MLIEAPLGNVFDASSSASVAVDWLDLSWLDCGRRFMRKKTRAGRDVRFLLRLGITLRHGDILCLPREDDPTIAINLIECETLVAAPTDVATIARLAFELGNLHVPMQLQDRHIITIADGPTQEAIDRLGVQYELQTRRFEPTLRPSIPMSIADDFELRSKSRD